MNTIPLRPKVGVAVFVCQNGKVLLHQRKGQIYPGIWAPAGGHLEFGEKIEDCVRRELLEESSLVAQEIALGPWTNDIMDHGHYVTFFAFVKKFSGTPQTTEPEKASDWQWFDWQALPEPIFPTVRSIIGKYGIAQLQHIAESKSDTTFGDLSIESKNNEVKYEFTNKK